MNTDGTQVIKLTKPDNGPIGFYIAKGNAKYRNGQFRSENDHVNALKLC